MKQLLILRHAKADWADASLDDHERPLNKRGQRDAPEVGALLRAQNILPQLILSSTATRAQETATRMAEAAGYDGEITQLASLYHAPPSSYIAALNALSDDFERVMVVGHNPGLEELIYTLTDQAEMMPTAALALVSLPIERWSDLTSDTPGEFLSFWRPDPRSQ
jgi:phosphohistidine phosphatase